MDRSEASTAMRRLITIQESLLINSIVKSESSIRRPGSGSLLRSCLDLSIVPHLYEVTGDRRWLNWTEELFEKILGDVVDLGSGSRNPALFGGLSGAVVFFSAADAIGVRGAKLIARSLAESIASALISSNTVVTTDFILGTTGHVRACYDVLPSDLQLRMTRRVLDGAQYMLSEHGKLECLDLGYAHGISSIAAAIGFLGTYRVNDAYLREMYSVCSQLLSILVAPLSFSPLRRPTTVSRSQPQLNFRKYSSVNGWCYGTIALDIPFRRFVETFSELPKRAPFRPLVIDGVPTAPIRDITFCHGAAGWVYYLLINRDLSVPGDLHRMYQSFTRAIAEGPLKFPHEGQSQLLYGGGGVLSSLTKFLYPDLANPLDPLFL